MPEPDTPFDEPPPAPFDAQEIEAAIAEIARAGLGHLTDAHAASYLRHAAARLCATLRETTELRAENAAIERQIAALAGVIEGAVAQAQVVYDLINERTENA